MSQLVKEWRPKLTKGDAASKIEAYQTLLTEYHDDSSLMKLVTQKLGVETSERVMSGVLAIDAIHNIDVGAVFIQRATSGKKTNTRIEALRKKNIFQKKHFDSLTSIFENDDDSDVRKASLQCIANLFHQDSDPKVFEFFITSHPSNDHDCELDLGSSKFYDMLASFGYSNAMEAFVKSRIAQTDFHYDRYIFTLVRSHIEHFEHLLPEFKNWLEKATKVRYINPRRYPNRPNFDNSLDHYMVNNQISSSQIFQTTMANLFSSFNNCFSHLPEAALFTLDLAIKANDATARKEVIYNLRLQNNCDNKELFDLIWQEFIDDSLAWITRMDMLGALLRLKDLPISDEKFYIKVIDTLKPSGPWLTFIAQSYLQNHQVRKLAKQSDKNKPLAKEQKKIKFDDQDIKELCEALLLDPSGKTPLPEKNKEVRSLYSGANRRIWYNDLAHDLLPKIFWSLAIELPSQRRVVFSAYWDHSDSLSHSVACSMRYLDITVDDFSGMKELEDAEYNASALRPYAIFLNQQTKPEPLTLIEVLIPKQDFFAIVVTPTSLTALQDTIDTLALTDVVLRDIGTDEDIVRDSSHKKAPRSQEAPTIDTLRPHQIAPSTVKQIFEHMCAGIPIEQHLKTWTLIEAGLVEQGWDKFSALDLVMSRLNDMVGAEELVVLSNDWKDNAPQDYQVAKSMTFLNLDFTQCTLTDEDYQQESYLQWRAYANFLKMHKLQLFNVDLGHDASYYIALPTETADDWQQLVAKHIGEHCLIAL